MGGAGDIKGYCVKTHLSIQYILFEHQTHEEQCRGLPWYHP